MIEEWKEYLAAIEAVDGFVLVRDYLAELSLPQDFKMEINTKF